MKILMLRMTIVIFSVHIVDEKIWIIVNFGVISFLLRAATVSSLSEPPSHTSGQAGDFDDLDGDVVEKADRKRKEIKNKSLQTFPNLAAIFNELSSHSFMKVQHSLVEISTAFSHFETNHHPIPCTEPVPRVLHMGNEGRSASCTQQSSKG